MCINTHNSTKISTFHFKIASPRNLNFFLEFHMFTCVAHQVGHDRGSVHAKWRLITARSSSTRASFVWRFAIKLGKLATCSREYRNRNRASCQHCRVPPVNDWQTWGRTATETEFGELSEWAANAKQRRHWIPIGSSAAPFAA